MSIKPIPLAQPPMDHPADIVVSGGVPSFREHFGAAGEQVLDSLDVVLAEPALVVVGELEDLLELIREETFILGCKYDSLVVEV